MVEAFRSPIRAGEKIASSLEASKLLFDLIEKLNKEKQQYLEKGIRASIFDPRKVYYYYKFRKLYEANGRLLRIIGIYIKDAAVEMLALQLLERLLASKTIPKEKIH